MFLQHSKYILLGGFVFWVIDAGFMSLKGVVPMRYLVIAKTVFLPAALVLTVRAVARRTVHKCSATARSYLLLTGIWLLGPVNLILTNLLADKKPMGLQEAIFHIVLFPLSTIVNSLYSGALGGLMITTVILCLLPFFTHGK